MNLTFSSVILLAIMAMVQSRAVTIPSPLHQMAHALAAVHRYRTVINVSMGSRGGAMTRIRTDTITVRHGTSFETYTVVTQAMAGQTATQEIVQTGTQQCIRPNRTGSWHCSAASPTGIGGMSDAQLSQTLQGLASGVKWTPAGDKNVDGQPCMGYRAASSGDGQTRERVTLWIARAAHRPVELRATTSSAIPGNQQTMTVTWSGWNDPSLAIPSIQSP